MIRYVVIGLLLFLGFILTFAPAGILASAISANSRAEVLNPEGTLWSGQGQLNIDHVAIGVINWNFDFSSLGRGTPGYRWTFKHKDDLINGFTGVGFSSVDAALQGRLDARSLNHWLRRYDIVLSGTIDVAPSSVTLATDSGFPVAMEGQISWDGGVVRYVLSGLLNQVTLPPMQAFINLSEQGVAEAVVYAQDQHNPLLKASLGQNGYVKVGITKLFTKMLNNPWPGSEPDHAVVIEVEEQIF